MSALRLSPGHRSTLTLLGLVFATATASANFVKGTLQRISDGDTVVFLATDEHGKTSKLKVRMVSMDAPEVHLPIDNGKMVGQGEFGDKATEHLMSLLGEGTPATLETFGEDKYHRVLGALFLGQQDINLQMVEDGWAVPYFICDGSDCDSGFFQRHRVTKYFKACESARDAELGIFDSKNPLKEMPFEFRLRMQKRHPDKWVGDFETKELVAPEDYAQVDLCQRIFFTSQKDAHRLGFR